MAITFSNSRMKSQKGIALEEAIVRGQAENGGLFVPEMLPHFSPKFIAGLASLSETQIVEELSAAWLNGSVEESVARNLAREAINFHTPIIQLGAPNYILELFHGPTLAFKDYGARYLARLLSYFLEKSGESQTILVATSGDTGSAVAAGFLGLKNIRVVVLYPSGRVSKLQEKQMTKLGHNIHALEVNGSFDDCQNLVKTAFNDAELRAKCRLNSANSINMARLIAQSFYYFLAHSRLFRRDLEPVFVVPSGNLGNLTAGILAKRMGLPVHQFVAATNANDVFVEFLSTQKYKPRPSIATISNAMDVGSPSNLERLMALYENDMPKLHNDIVGYSTSDAATRDTIRDVADEYGYVLDPHAAVGYHALWRWRLSTGDKDRPGIVLATAHPGKFQADVESAIGRALPLPLALQQLENKTKHAEPMENNWSEFKKWLLKF
jgi:threonine synthase